MTWVLSDILRVAAQGRRLSRFAPMRLANVHELIRDAVRWAGGVLSVEGLSPEERRLLAPTTATEAPAGGSTAAEDWADRGWDDRLLGELRPLEERRALGQFLTPHPIVRVMVDWIRRHCPGQVVDAGCGTGRFAIAASRALPDARVIAIDIDPVATLLCRAQVQRLGLQNVEVRCADYVREDLGLQDCRTALSGRPGEVRAAGNGRAAHSAGGGLRGRPPLLRSRVRPAGPSRPRRAGAGAPYLHQTSISRTSAI
jgi:hypothetical protein